MSLCWLPIPYERSLSLLISSWQHHRRVVGTASSRGSCEALRQRLFVSLRVATHRIRGAFDVVSPFTPRYNDLLRFSFTVGRQYHKHGSRQASASRLLTTLPPPCRFSTCTHFSARDLARRPPVSASTAQCVCAGWGGRAAHVCWLGHTPRLRCVPVTTSGAFPPHGNPHVRKGSG